MLKLRINTILNIVNPVVYIYMCVYRDGDEACDYKLITDYTILCVCTLSNY